MSAPRSRASALRRPARAAPPASAAVEANAYLTLERDVRAMILGLATARADLLERETEHRRETDRLLLALVEVIDAFERVFDSVRESDLDAADQRLVGNFQTVYRLLSRTLREQRVVPIVTVAPEFDPRYHEVVETVDDPATPPGTIMREPRRGYLRDETVLRMAGVVVSSEGGAGWGG